jgi:porin
MGRLAPSRATTASPVHHRSTHGTLRALVAATLFRDELIFRIGKMVQTYDFGNVARSVSVQGDALRIPAVTGLLYTPVFVNPSSVACPAAILGMECDGDRGAKRSALCLSWSSMMATAPTVFRPGWQAGRTVNTYRFGIVELGAGWLLGPDHLPGSFGAGGWRQVGTLSLSARNDLITENGTQGLYAFGSQSPWRGQATGDPRSVPAFMQIGVNNSRTMLATSCVGFGLTAFGVVPGQMLDSVGIVVAWSTLNQNQGVRPDPELCSGPRL